MRTAAWVFGVGRRLLHAKVGAPARVRIVEVGPRDGLQNEKSFVPTERKVALVENLVRAGIEDVEVTGFVSPKWIPQLADAADVFKAVKKKHNVIYSALVPNLRGLESAIEVGAKNVAVFAAASETFSMRNINCSIATSLQRYESVCSAALSRGIKVRGYVSTVAGCPYEGRVDPEKVADVAQSLLDMGCYEVSLGDTIGVATPNDVVALIETVSKKVPVSKLAVHFHDTRGTALANVLTALEQGVHVVDSSVGGLGGCPYAPGAAGNLATEDLVYMLRGMGVNVGNIDLPSLARLGAETCAMLGRPSGSKCGQAILATAEPHEEKKQSARGQ
mmetsp:Transcript_4362/g.13196  ORF Transcript_4362/g.13196 Transcript_4362/m.13196 type:complete len:333 (-) Transcript_4362:1593-2591(-)